MSARLSEERLRDLDRIFRVEGRSLHVSTTEGAALARELLELRALRDAAVEWYLTEDTCDEDCSETEYDRWESAHKAWLLAIPTERARMAKKETSNV
jgi:hypothetical protein